MYCENPLFLDIMYGNILALGEEITGPNLEFVRGLINRVEIGGNGIF